MIGNSGEDGVCSIDLFEGDDEGKFVLEGERAEGPEQVRAFDHPWGEAVCATDKQRTRFSRISLDFPDFLSKRAASQAFASFIEDQTKTSFAPAEQLSALARWIGGLDVGCLNSAETSQTRQILGNPRARVNQARFPDRDDAPAQGWS
jgi:hypothetical protein